MDRAATRRMARSWLRLAVPLLGLLILACGPAATATPTPTATPRAAVPTPTTPPSVVTATPTRPATGSTPTTAPTVAATATPTRAVAAPTPTATRAPVPTVPPGEQPRRGGVIKRGQGGEPPGFDLHQTNTTLNTNVTMPIYNNLVFQGIVDTTEIVPDLAKTWSVSPDGMVWTFNLVDNAKWHDGVPFTSADVVATFARLKTPPTGISGPRQDQFQAIKSVEAVDPHTVRFTLEYPQAAFLPILVQGYTNIVAKHLLEKHNNNLSKVTIGTGPFVFKEYEPGVFIRLERNPNYFKAGLPYLDGQDFTFIVEPSVFATAFRAKRVDTGHGSASTGWGPADRKALEAEHGNLIRFKEPIALAPWVIWFNLNQAPWNDVRVRRAFHLALNRFEMVDANPTGHDYDIGVMAVHPNGTWSLPRDAFINSPGYRRPKDQDEAEARRLLADAGIKTPLEVQALVRRFSNYDVMALIVADQLRKVGINVTLDLQETATYNKRAESGQFGVHIGGYSIPMDDPDSHFPVNFVTGAGRNYGRYTNPKLDVLNEQQTKTVDEAKRKEIVREMIGILREDLPVVNAWNRHGIGTPEWAWVHNWYPSQRIGGNNGTLRYEQVWMSERK